MKKCFIALILLLSFNNILSDIAPPDDLLAGYKFGQNVTCGSYHITSPYASACWFGYKQNNEAHSQHLAIMPAGSTCADTDPYYQNCIHNPYNNELSWIDPKSYSTLCKPYIDLVANTGGDNKKFATRLAKACLVGYDTKHDSGCWCPYYENVDVYDN